MTTTEKHEDFLAKLTKLLEEFHKDNPDLFIKDIDITYGRDGFQRLHNLGTRVEIVVQPTLAD